MLIYKPNLVVAKIGQITDSEVVQLCHKGR